MTTTAYTRRSYADAVQLGMQGPVGSVGANGTVVFEEVLDHLAAREVDGRELSTEEDSIWSTDTPDDTAWMADVSSVLASDSVDSSFNRNTQQSESGAGDCFGDVKAKNEAMHLWVRLEELESWVESTLGLARDLQTQALENLIKMTEMKKQIVEQLEAILSEQKRAEGTCRV
ncbi:hypothetical protein FS749_006225 [Ceratobasidium sp. UAMH 11750]|nr:hypothetical protein FS749_006225 [Ceratobasidium sp. UAMH 11750]